MATELRKTGITVVGDVPWGTHFCYFYETKQDLLDILVPYFKTGLESKEFCLWIISNSELITTEEARKSLGLAVRDLDRYLAEGRIEIVRHDEWFLKGGAFDVHQVANRFKEKLNEALAKGYAGMRVNGSPAWIQTRNTKELREFEEEVDLLFPNQRIIASCTYPLPESQAEFLLDVARSHQFVIARRQGNWDVLETPELIQAKQEIKSLNQQLEERVIERTRELAAANEELRKEIAERKRAEEALKQAQSRIESVLNGVADLHSLFDRNGRFLYANEAAVRAFGHPREQIIGRKLWEVFPDIVGTELERQFRRAMEERVHVAFEFYYPRTHTWWENRYYPAPEGLSVFATDITERKQAEDVLRRSEDRLRLVIDTIPTMAWSLRPDAVLDFVNQRWLDYTGLSFEEAIEDETRTVHPEDLSRVMEKWLVIKHTSEAYEDEMRLQRADGEYRWFLIRIAPLLDEQGNLLKRYGIAIDIEERKRAEETLQYSQTQFAEAQRLAHVGSWDWDLRRNAITWSDELYRIFGLQPGKMTKPGDAMPFIHPEDRDLVFSTVQSAVKNKEAFSFYYRVLRPDGSERLAHSRGHIVSDESGEPIRVFGATQDVTELKRAEEKLKATSEQLRALSARAQSAREEEATRIAREIHDELGSSLTRLKWDLELIAKGDLQAVGNADDARLREKMTAMSAIIDDTVDVVRRISAELRPSVLDDLGLAAALRLHTKQFQDRTGIVTDCDCTAENLGLNQQQSTALFRVFEEALTNVMRHAGATQVDVNLTRDNSDLVLTIRDNGRGITEAEMLYPSSLGLLGMRERVNLIGGELNITGTVGQGTTITVRLPGSEQH